MKSIKDLNHKEKEGFFFALKMIRSSSEKGLAILEDEDLRKINQIVNEKIDWIKTNKLS